MSTQTETERKYLIVRPEESVLSALPSSQIAQTYLFHENGVTDRVRRRAFGARVQYTRTRKTRLSPMSCTEEETEISKEEYESLLKNAAPVMRSVHKTRYLLKEGNLTFEIDVYPFWTKQAVMEVELPDESAAFSLPRAITVLREVTGNKAYSNAALARAVPPEDL